MHGILDPCNNATRAACRRFAMAQLILGPAHGEKL
jgi:hypothetical protein